MDNYIFFKSQAGESVFPDLRILPNQTIVTPTGNTYDAHPEWRVASAQPDVIAAYPLGTAFACKNPTVIPGRDTYSLRDVRPVSVPSSDIKDADHNPSPEALEEWERYTGANPLWNADTIAAKVEEEKPAAKAKTSAKAPALKPLQVIRKDFPAPTVSKDGFWVKTDIWEQLVNNVKFRLRPTILLGPTGTGKTELVLKLGEMLGLSVSVYDMGSMHDPLAQLIGQQSLVNGEHGSVTDFQYSKFVSDIQEPGIILLDELSRAPASANNILFPLLDRRRCLYTELAGDKASRVVKMHPGCVILATANIGCQYTGTETLDEALVNRFDTLELDYLKPSDEASLLVKVTGISTHDASIIASVCDTVRTKFRESKLSRALSTRQSILAAENVADGWDLKTAMTLAFEKFFDGEGGTSSERATVHNIIIAH